MLASEACTCSLQARLHQVENARSREMEAHGEQVQHLTIELEARRSSEKELRLAVAKLRADTCRLQAEFSTAHAKARQLSEQIDAQSVEASKREDEFKRVLDESKRQLQDARGKSDQLMEEKRQLNVELSESRNCLDHAKREHKLLLSQYEGQKRQARSQAEEIVKLTSQVTSKQQEIDAVTMRSQLLLKDLTSSREQLESMQRRIQKLEREVDRALVTRNRALQWRQKRLESWRNRIISHSSFLAWKAGFVQAKLKTSESMARFNHDTKARLQAIEMEVLKRCSHAKEELSRVRQLCVIDRSQMQSLRQEICQTELPKLLVMVENHRQFFINRQHDLELQFVTRRELFQSEQEQIDMSRQDLESSAQKILENHQTHLVHLQETIFQSFASRRVRALHRRVFSAWKEFYLRSVVGQTTHTAMVFQSQQPQSPALKVSSPVVRSERTSIRPIPLAVQPLQLERQSFDNFLRSPLSEPTTPIDTMWRRWRRIDAGLAGRGNTRKYRRK